MKKLILILALFLIPVICYSQDRVSVRVEFKKAVWTCPICGQEDIQDLIVSGGNDYTHKCSKCGQWFNNFKEYNGTLSYPYDDYLKVSDEIKDEKKKELCDKWIYEIKHPPVYVEPSLDDYQKLYNEKMDEATQYLDKIAKITTELELTKNKVEGKEKIDKVTK